MTKTKNQFARLQVLHNLLAKGKPVSKADIEKSYRDNNIAISKKTIYNDLADLRDVYDAPLDNKSRKHFYTEGFSLLNRFNAKDSLLAADAMVLLQQFAEFPLFKGLEDIWIRLEERLPKTTKKQVVQFEQNDEYIGLRRLHELYEAIKNQTTLKIKYQDFEKEVQEHSISPYILKEYNNRWHIYGYEHKKEKIYNLALDRILSIENSGFSFRTQKTNDLAFLNDIIGFTYYFDKISSTYLPLETVKIKVDAKRANYIRTKPLHYSQQEIVTESTEKYKIFEYRLRVNNELIAKLLEFGKDAEVIEPLSLREEMIEHVLGMMKVYK